MSSHVTTFKRARHRLSDNKSVSQWKSGTVPVIYPALNTDPSNMTLSQICENRCKTGGPSYTHDIPQTRKRPKSHSEQLIDCTVRVLRHLKGLESIVNCEDFQHLERRKLPVGHAMKKKKKKKKHPLCASLSRRLWFEGTSRWTTISTSLNSRCRRHILTTKKFPCIDDQLIKTRLRTAHSPVHLTVTHPLGSNSRDLASVFLIHIST